MLNLQEELKKIIYDSGLTLRELSKLLDVDNAFLSRLQSGRQKVTFEMFSKIITKLNYQIELKIINNNMKNLSAIIEKTKHTNRDVSSGGNGYPEPFEGKFIGNFDTFEEIEEFVSKYGGEISKAYWKDGWKNVEIRGAVYEPFTPKFIDYGDNTEVINDSYGLNQTAFGRYQELLEEYGETEDKEEIEELETAKNYGENLMKECKNVNFETHSVLLSEGVFDNTIPKLSLQASHDTKNYEIGVFVSKELL
jgi:transcriptional regulator with XRE-family HTH domain